MAPGLGLLRDVGDPDRADDFDAMSPEEYAEHKHVEMKNPISRSVRKHQRRTKMARPNYAELRPPGKRLLLNFLSRFGQILDECVVGTLLLPRLPEFPATRYERISLLPM